MKLKIIVIVMFVVYLFIGVGLLIVKQNGTDTIVFVAIKICGIAFIAISLYVMYTFKELVE